MKKGQYFRKPYRIKRKKSIFGNRFFWLAILILIIFGGVFYLICFASTFQIREIRVSGNQKVSTENLENLIRENISQRILWFSSQSIFLANLNKIKAKLLEKFLQIAQTSLNREFPDILLAQIEERKPIAIFRQNENTFFIDREGVIFEEIFEEEPQKLKLKNLTLTTDLKLGEKAIEERQLSQILEIESKLKGLQPARHPPPERAPDLEISLVEVSIISEERLNAKTSEGWEIYFNPKGDLNWQITKLSLVLEERIPPEKRRNVEYIDLRFERIYIFPETYRQ